jgi:hypothetical protein
MTSNKEGMGDKPPERKDSQKEGSPSEVAPVTGEFLIELGSSPDFIGLLEETARYMKDTPYDEAGFGIIKELDSDRTYFTGLCAQKGFALTEIERQLREIEERLELKNPEKKTVILATLHFHPSYPHKPSQDPIIIPTGTDGDLDSTAVYTDANEIKTGHDFPPIEMISAITTDNEVKMLIYQEPLGEQHAIFPRTISKELQEALKETNFTDQEQILELLRKYNYKAEIIRTKKSVLDDQALQTLASFAFTPAKTGG